jgi:hypothetical protein
MMSDQRRVIAAGGVLTIDVVVQLLGQGNKTLVAGHPLSHFAQPFDQYMQNRRLRQMGNREWQGAITVMVGSKSRGFTGSLQPATQQIQ